jgi:serine protease Do
MTRLSKSQVAVYAAVALLGLAARANADSTVYKQTLASTTWVVAKTELGLSRGSGVLVDAERRLVLTNYHVTLDAREALVFFPYEKDGATVAERDFYVRNAAKLGIKGKVIAVDRKRDLALILLKSVEEGTPAVKLAETSPSPGDTVHSLGNPGVSGALWAYASGNVRSVYKKKFRTGVGEHEFRVVETDSAINSGDSGGPVVNSNGELVAITQSISTKASLLSFSVDITEVKEFLEGDYRQPPSPITDVLETASLTGEKLDSGAYKVEIEKDGKKRTVFVANAVDSFGKAETRKVWSLAATLEKEPTTETILEMLAQNAKTKLGAWTIEKSKTGYVVMYVAKIDATTSPEVYRSTMEYVSRLAEEMGNKLNPSTTAKTESTDDWFKGL